MLHRTVSLASIALAVSVLSSTVAMASAQRTFVASYGSPGNTAFNCSITKPCRAFSEATSVTNNKGEVIVLDSAGYGPVTIINSVSIIASPGVYAGITVFAPDDGVTVNAPGAIVVLRGLSINGQGGLRGILLQAAARVRIENCVVSGMSSAGISHNAPGAEMIVLDTIVRDNGGAGVNVNGDLSVAVLERVRSEHNGGGGFYLAPTPGSPGIYATIVDSLFTHNGGNGIQAESIGGSTVTIVVERTVMANNGNTGFLADGPSGSSVDATVARSTVNHNGNGGIIFGTFFMTFIPAHATTRASILNNVLHRNGKTGLYFEAFVGGQSMQLVMKDNIANAHSSFDFVCSIPAGGFFNTDGSNVIQTSFLSSPVCNAPVKGGI